MDKARAVVWLVFKALLALVGFVILASLAEEHGNVVWLLLAFGYALWHMGARLDSIDRRLNSIQESINAVRYPATRDSDF